MKCPVQAGAPQRALKNDVFVTWLFPKIFSGISENIVSLSELRIGDKFSPRGPSWGGGSREWTRNKTSYHLSNSFVTENTLVPKTLGESESQLRTLRGRSASSPEPGCRSPARSPGGGLHVPGELPAARDLRSPLWGPGGSRSR